MKTHVVVLVPTFNERANISLLLKELDQLATNNKTYKWTTLIVDDQSPDGTAFVVQNYKPKTITISLLSGKKNGLGVALCKGIKFAITSLSADIVITNEADFAYDTKYLLQILDKLEEGYDVVFTSRHTKKSEIEGWNFNRKLNHFVANKVFATWVAGVHQISDHNGLLRGAKSDVLKKINWDKITTKGFSFINYWGFLLTKNSKCIFQLPIVYKYRTRGESKVSFNKKYLKTYLHDIIEYILVYLKIRFY